MTAAVPSGTLAYDAEGQGPALVLLHPFPLSRATWKRARAQWGRFARVLTPDLPGFGDSPRQPAPSIPAMASSVWAWLDRLELQEPVIAAGVSMGGYVVFEMARQAPGRVRALGLLATRASGDTVEQQRTRLKLAEQVRRDGLQPLVEAMVPKLLTPATRSARPAVACALIEEIRRNTPEGVADALAAMAHRADHTARLPSLTCPALIVAGAEDAVISLAHTTEMAQRLPNARLEVVPGAGHLVHLEQPESLDGIVERFVRSLPDH